MTNAEIRAWYQNQVSNIDDLNRAWIAVGLGARERAHRAWEIRHEARVQARSMMEDAAEVEQLRARDKALYGNPDGPTFANLVKAHRRSGATLRDAYERILRGAQHTNSEVDDQFRRGRSQ